jgi:hypothetical protein
MSFVSAGAVEAPPALRFALQNPKPQTRQSYTEKFQL